MDGHLPWLNVEPRGSCGSSKDRTSADSLVGPPETQHEVEAREERQMMGRIEEAISQLTYVKLDELRDRERTVGNMKDAAALRRDVKKVRARMKNHGRYLLNQSAIYMQAWDMLILLAMIFTVFVTPYEIAFLTDTTWSPPVNLLITFVFACDIVKEFFVPFQLSSKLGGAKVMSHKQIAVHYLRGSFALDVVATVPIDVFVGLASASEGESSATPLKMVRMVRLVRLARLGRLLRGSRVVQRLVEVLEKVVTISYTTREVTFWTVAMLVVFHWLSCVWGLVALMREPQRSAALEEMRLSSVPACERGPGTCLSECEMELLAELPKVTANATGSTDMVIIRFNEGWLCRAIEGGVLPPEDEGQHGSNYLYCLVDMVLMFGIGVYPRNPVEYTLAIFCAIVNMVMNTFFLGVVATAMGEANPIARDFKGRMDRLNHYLSESEAPPQLRRRTRDYLKYTRDLVARKSFDDVYETFSPRLRDDLHAHTSLRQLRLVPYFRDCEEPFLRSLAPKLTQYGFEASERVPLAEASLCIVTRGTAVKGGKPITLGQFWGDDFILSSAALHDRRLASALTYMEMVCLTRTSLLESMEEFPESARVLRRVALHLAMLRAPQLIARYFEMKLPAEASLAVQRRGLSQSNKKGNFLGRCSPDVHGSAESSERVSRSSTAAAMSSKSLFFREQAVGFDSALKNLGSKAPAKQREYHGIMRAINGGALLRGFARDQRYSADLEVRSKAKDALKVAGDEGRLILDEACNVVGADGKVVHVKNDEGELPRITAIRELHDHFRAEMKNMKRAVQSIQVAMPGRGSPGMSPARRAPYK